MLHRAFCFDLHPTPEQEAKLEQFVGVTRLVYNLALEQRTTWRGPTLASQEREVTQLRAENDFIAEVPRYVLTAALRDLDRAMAAFFAKRARFPRFRRKGKSDSFRVQGRDTRTRPLNRRWSEVFLPKLGMTRFRSTRNLIGEVQNVTVARRGGKWIVSFACVMEPAVAELHKPSVGIDRGVANTLMLSTGEAMCLPSSLAEVDRRKRKAQRVLSRRKRGSRRHGKARQRVTRIAARLARIRSDWQHRTSLNIARRFGHVALEDLNIKGLTRGGRGASKRGLNRSILEQGWYGFASKLTYKLEERCGTLVLVDPRYTSQACSACGAIDSESRKSQASFVCTSCGFALNADHNAALNILRRSTPPMPVDGSGCAPVEAGTCLEAA